MLRAAVLPTELATCRGAAGRGHPGARPAYSEQHTPDYRAPPGAAVRQLSPRAQSRRLEWASSCPRAAWASAGRLPADRAAAAGPRRHDRAAARQAQQRHGGRSGSGPVQPRPLGEGQRPALAQPDAAGADLLGWAGLGAAVPDSPCPLGAVLPRAGLAPQEADRLGPAAGPAGPPLDAGPAPDPGDRQRLLRPRVFLAALLRQEVTCVTR